MKPALRPSDALTRHSSGVSNTRLQIVRKGRNRECLAGDAQAHPCGARYSAITGLIAPRQGTPGPGPSGTSVGRVSVIICRTAVARTAVARTDVARIAVALTSFGTRVELARTDEGIRFDGRYEARDGLIASAHGRACSGPAKGVPSMALHNSSAPDVPEGCPRTALFTHHFNANNFCKSTSEAGLTR